MKFKVLKTYEAISPESAKTGDIQEAGILKDGSFPIPTEELEEEMENYYYLMDIREIFEELNNNSYFFNSRYFSTVDPERCYNTGEEIYYSFHIKTSEKNINRIIQFTNLA